MAKYRIAVLPGDGVGKDVMDAAMIVLKKLNLDADYRFGDIGWEFRYKDGNPQPPRPIQLLRETDVCLPSGSYSTPSAASPMLNVFSDDEGENHLIVLLYSAPGVSTIFQYSPEPRMKP